MTDKSGKIIWLTGLSGSGKTTLAQKMLADLNNLVIRTIIIDGDLVRKGLCSDLGFSDLDRNLNIRRVRHLVKTITDNGINVICTFVSPFLLMRTKNRLFFGSSYILIYVKCSFLECNKRDVKGLYKKAAEGKIQNFTGMQSKYLIPENPDIIVNTLKFTISLSSLYIIELLQKINKF